MRSSIAQHPTYPLLGRFLHAKVDTFHWGSGENYKYVPTKVKIEMIGELDHIEIVASDAEEMCEFLQKLGFEIHRETEHHGKSYELTPPNTDLPIFEIHTVEDDEVPGLNHIAFASNDIEELSEELKRKDIDQVSDPYHVDVTGRTIMNFRDPDGRRFQAVSDEK